MPVGDDTTKNGKTSQHTIIEIKSMDIRSLDQVPIGPGFETGQLRIHTFSENKTPFRFTGPSMIKFSEY